MSLAHLPSRAILKVTGEDKDAFLQGLITNDIHLLKGQKAIYACLLTPQGKYLYDFFIVSAGGAYLIDCEAKVRGDLLKKLKLHKLRSKVTIEEVESEIYALWGEGDWPHECYADPRLEALGHRLISKKSLEHLNSEENYIQHCHLHGVPYHSLDLVPQKSILLESNLDELNAISWDKGCYMGQELTARTKHRGLVRKRLFPVNIEGSPPEYGARVYQGNKVVGEMRSSLKNLGIALLRLEALENKAAPFTVEGSQLRPYIPGWMGV